MRGHGPSPEEGGGGGGLVEAPRGDATHAAAVPL